METEYQLYKEWREADFIGKAVIMLGITFSVALVVGMFVIVCLMFAFQI